MGIKLLLALIGGVLAAIVCGVIWGWIVSATGYEIGYMALGIGFVCGFAVVMFSGGETGLPLQFIAVISSILGIAIGKYLAFYNVSIEIAKKEYGAEAVSGVSVFSGEVIQLFFDNLSSILNGFDILWLVLAVYTAWRIPKLN